MSDYSTLQELVVEPFELPYTAGTLTNAFRSFRRRLIASAIFVNFVVIAASFVISGWNHAGAGAATRYTARFAILFFLIGFAAHGLCKWISWFPESAIWMQAFVAAQFVHFGAVIIMHTVFAESGLHLGTQEIALVLIGFTIVSGVGLTAVPLPGHRFRSWIHVFLIYLILVILVADYSQHLIRSLRWFLLPIVAAAVLRHLHRHKPIENARPQVPVA